MDGEKIQWLILDGGMFSVTSPLTTDEIKLRRGKKWYRPLVKYECTHEVTPGVHNFTTEIRDTSRWLESQRKLEEMRQRDGIELEEEG